MNKLLIIIFVFIFTLHAQAQPNVGETAANSGQKTKTAADEPNGKSGGKFSYLKNMHTHLSLFKEENPLRILL